MDPAAPLLERHIDGGAGRRVFDRVVREDGAELFEGLLIAEERDVRSDVQNITETLLFRHEAEGLEGLPAEFREVEVALVELEIALRHLGHGDEFSGHRGQSPDLFMDAFGPLALPFGHLEDFRAGIDDGERGLQLMTGVCDELPLLVITLLDGSDGPLREEDDQHRDEQQRCGRDHQTHDEQIDGVV